MELGTLDRFFAETLLKREGIYTEEKAFVLSKVMQSARIGNLCLAGKDVGDVLDSLPSSIVEEGKDLFPKAPIIRSNNRYYLQKNWVYETYLLQLVQKRRLAPVATYFEISRFEENLQALLHSGQLFPSQADAIRSVLKSSLSLICGGPGTGKTYTASHLVKLLFSSMKRQEKPQLRICLAAPTGKAAFHLRSSLEAQGLSDPALQVETATLHRLLRLQPGVQRLFSKRRLDADLVIVDEASMIDVPLLAHLLEAIGEETLLVLIGDPDQLPPVETGSLFAEMASLFGIFLDRCARTSESRLQELAQAIKVGNGAAFSTLLESQHGCAIRLTWPFDAKLGEKLHAWIDPVVMDDEPNPKDCMEKYGSHRILNAKRLGLDGADVLNREIFQMIQDKKAWWAAPILATVNDPYEAIYNGMSGVLIGRTLQDAIAYFPDPSSKEMRRFPSPPPYELAFCLSIHKSQGSEFQQVLALFPEGSEQFGREALYTALTRAKEKIEIVGSEEVLRQMIALTSRRTSGFSVRWQQMRK